MGTHTSKTSRKATGKGSISRTVPRWAGKSIHAAVDDFLLGNHSRPLTTFGGSQGGEESGY